MTIARNNIFVAYDFGNKRIQINKFKDYWLVNISKFKKKIETKNNN